MTRLVDAETDERKHWRTVDRERIMRLGIQTATVATGEEKEEEVGRIRRRWRSINYDNDEVDGVDENQRRCVGLGHGGTPLSASRRGGTRIGLSHVLSMRREKERACV